MQGVDEGVVVITDTQSAGRGKPGNSWFSPPGLGIYLSIILKPRKNPNDLPSITKLGAQAVVELIKEQAGLVAMIKEPNDVLVDGKKIGGVLTERLMTGEIIMGIGMNVNNPVGSFPTELLETATSLMIASNKPWPVKGLTKRLIELIESGYLAYLRGIC